MTGNCTSIPLNEPEELGVVDNSKRMKERRKLTTFLWEGGWDGMARDNTRLPRSTCRETKPTRADCSLGRLAESLQSIFFPSPQDPLHTIHKDWQLSSLNLEGVNCYKIEGRGEKARTSNQDTQDPNLSWKGTHTHPTTTRHQQKPPPHDGETTLTMTGQRATTAPLSCFLLVTFASVW
mmetsp:Transcript_6739/g.15386  ORF Transcript_6739/g.15386 Transcript_6739/m.15386 type:complete len:179 (-) Transcript_6739:859-1395(-)